MRKNIKFIFITSLYLVIMGSLGEVLGWNDERVYFLTAMFSLWEFHSNLFLKQTRT